MKIEFDLKTITVPEAESVVWLLKQHIIPSVSDGLTEAKKQLARAYKLSMSNDVGIKPSAEKFGGDLPKAEGDFPTTTTYQDEITAADNVRLHNETLVSTDEKMRADAQQIERDLVNDPSTWGEELDSEGKPWDATLHTQNRSKTSNGVWKKGRGKGALVPEVPVGLGLSSSIYQPTIVAEDRVPEGYTQPHIGDVVPPVPVAPAAPLAPVPPVPEVVPASAPPETQITFPQFLTAVTKEITRNTNFKNVSNDALNQLGLASIGQLNKAPEKMVDYIRITGLMI